MTLHKPEMATPSHGEPCATECQTNDRYDKFLAVLAESSNVTRSAEEAGLTTSAAYKRRRNDAAFARRWLAALYEGYLHLEMDVLRRLREGQMQGENNDKYDFANAIRLLSAHRENAARATAQQRNVTAAAVRASIDRKVEEIRKQVQLEKSKKSRTN